MRKDKEYIWKSESDFYITENSTEEEIICKRNQAVYSCISDFLDKNDNVNLKANYNVEIRAIQRDRYFVKYRCTVR
jgi:hypothetical protein